MDAQRLALWAGGEATTRSFIEGSGTAVQPSPPPRTLQ